MDGLARGVGLAACVERPIEQEDFSGERLEVVGKYLAGLSIGALGIVYGDIGTSPLWFGADR